jgi:hypothetical protein
MRLMSLMFVLALLAMASMALADAPASPLPSFLVAAPAAPELPAGLNTPEPSFMTSCSASLTCGDGNVASCTGNTCSTTPNSAKCDGVHYRCPNYCIVREQCYCGGTLQCQSNVGACASNADDTVTCDGQTINCPNFCL